MTPLRRIIELRLALMMLTRLPMGHLPDPAPDLAQARWAFPLAGLPAGLAVWAVLSGAAWLGLPPLAGAFAALAGAAALTGGLHHDGLADFVDGMGGRDRAHRLEIMRDSRIGSFGVIALLFAVGLSATTLSAIPASAWAGILLVAVASRLAMLVLLDLLPSARADGLGRMAASGHKGARFVWLPGMAVAVGLGLILGPTALPVLAAMAGAALFIAWRARRSLGGQTGDVLGAAQLASETTGWLALAAAL